MKKCPFLNQPFFFGDAHDVSRTTTGQTVLLEPIELSHYASGAQMENTLSLDSLNAHIGQSQTNGVTVYY
jgi:hypothetical protein